MTHLLDVGTDSLIGDWLSSRVESVRPPTSRRRRRSLLRSFAASVDVPILDATPFDVEAWLAGGDLAEASGRLYLSILDAFFRWAQEEHRCGDNPVTADMLHHWRRRERVAEQRRTFDVEPSIEAVRRCQCGATASEMRRVGGEGPPLCPTCYQRGRRERLAMARTSGDPLYAALVGDGLSPRTVRLYLRTVAAAQRWFAEQGWHLATATGVQVATYAATLPPSWASQKGLRSALARYWDMTEHPGPPLRAIRVPPKPAMVCLALDEDDARVLAVAARGRGDLKGLAVLLGLYQALRREEIATLTWDAFAEDGWMTIQGKNRKRRSIPLHPVVAAHLAVVERTGSYVFPGHSTGAVNPATIWSWIGEVAENAGVPDVRPHRLRHTALATQNDATGDLRTVQAFAGHSNPQTTAGYTRASKSRMQALCWRSTTDAQTGRFRGGRSRRW